jgi:hypothetical protein
MDQLTRLTLEVVTLLSFLDVLHAINYDDKQTKASNNLQLYVARILL